LPLSTLLLLLVYTFRAPTEPSSVLRLYSEAELRMRKRESGRRSYRRIEDLYLKFVEEVKDYAIFMTDAEGLVVSWNLAPSAFWVTARGRYSAGRSHSSSPPKTSKEVKTEKS
jgi:hypothetical protein